MRGLNKLYWLKIDIKNIKEEIAEIEEEIARLPTISSPQITGMPHGTGVSNPLEKYYLKKEALEEKLKQRRVTLEEKRIKSENEKNRLENIIEQIDVPEIKTMASMRFVSNKSWEDIGRATNYDRSVCYRKVKKYIDGMDI